LFAKLFEQKKSKSYLKTEMLSSELLSIIDIIEKLERISKKIKIKIDRTESIKRKTKQ